MQKIGFSEAVEDLVEKDSRYDRDAYGFIRDALEHTVKQVKGDKAVGSRHVEPGQLLDGVRDYALKEFGPMASTVLDYWGIRDSMDIGHLVFNLIEAGVFGKTETDNIEDFAGGFDFHEAFVGPFLARAPQPPADRNRTDNPA